MLGEVFRARVGVDAETGATYINLHSNFCLDHDKGLIFFTVFFNLPYYSAVTSKYTCNRLRLQKIKELEGIVKSEW